MTGKAGYRQPENAITRICNLRLNTTNGRRYRSALERTAKMRASGFIITAVLLSGCAAQQQARLRNEVVQARAACADQWGETPATIVQRANCFNDVSERLVAPHSPNPDLLRLDEAARSALAEKVAKGEMSFAEAKLRMAQVEAQLTSEAQRRSAERAIANAQNINAEAQRTSSIINSMALIQAGQNMSTMPYYLPHSTTNCRSALTGNFVNTSCY